MGIMILIGSRRNLTGKYIDENNSIWLDKFTQKSIKRKLRGIKEKTMGKIGKHDSFRWSI